MSKLKILLLEDKTDDATFLQKYLDRSGLKFESVISTSKLQLMLILQQHQFDVVLAGHSLASIECLKMARMKDKNIPFILVSETVSEESAIKIIQDEGADDYILTDHLARLPTAIRQAIKHRRIKREKELCESKLEVKTATGTSGIKD